MGFEPTRAEPTGLAGRRLNHSAKVSLAFLSQASARIVGEKQKVLFFLADAELVFVTERSGAVASVLGS